jgi:hypothetical protein
LSCTMGMSALRAASSSPMSALRSTPALVTKTSAGRGSRKPWMPPLICARQEGEGTPC